MWPPAGRRWGALPRRRRQKAVCFSYPPPAARASTVPASEQAPRFRTANCRPLSWCVPQEACRHHALWRGWRRGRNDRSPSAGALLHIRVVALRIVAIVPGGLGRRLWCGLDIDLRGRRDDDRRVAIRRPVRSPVGCPERPNGEHKRRPEENMPAMVPEVMATEAMATTPRMPWHCARHEQRHQYDDSPHPLLPHARCLVPVTHRDHLSRITVLWSCEIPHPATQRDTQGSIPDRVGHTPSPLSPDGYPDLYSHCTPDFPDLPPRLPQSSFPRLSPQGTP